jgi:hypothetical protein
MLKYGVPFPLGIRRILNHEPGVYNLNADDQGVGLTILHDGEGVVINFAADLFRASLSLGVKTPQDLIRTLQAIEQRFLQVFNGDVR